MKPLLIPPPPSSNNISILIFCVTLLVISINVPTCVCDDHDKYTNCNADFSCKSSISELLKYPFWGENREEYCGGVTNNPDMLKLTCENSTVPMITFNEIKYRILNWVNTTQILTVARDDYWDGGDICDADQHKNSTFDNLPFQRSGDIANVTLLYNCAANPVNTLSRVNCHGGNSTVVVYTSLDQASYSTLCSDLTAIVVVPLLGASLASTLVAGSDISKVINEGFGMKYTGGGDFAECVTCVNTGGVCGNDGGTSFRCFCKDGSHETTCQSPIVSSSSKSNSTVGIAIGAAAGVAVLVGLLAFACFVVRRRKKNAEKSRSRDLFLATPSSGTNTGTLTSTTNSSQSVPSYPSSKSHHDTVQKSFYFGVQVFTYAELEEATNNFHTSKEIGEGGFGTVYKGELKDGRVVAVKRHYESSFKRVEQFMNEVEILAHLRHKNLVTLFGCTSRHSRELLLVYEFISNGTVADHLHKKSKSTLLPWPVRLNIAVETAEALAFLHASDVIHRDVKSNNILLDDKFHVKVADFGLSRLFPNQMTHVSTAPQGTPGYVDPEYYQYYQLTDKSDVYSFGVVLVELITSLEAVDISRNRNDVNLANMAINKIQSQELHELVDPYLGFEKDHSVRRMTTAVAELAFRCLQHQRDMRPSMDEVLEILRGIKSDELDTKEAKVEDDDVVKKTDEVVLLKKVPSPDSPDSVAHKWVSGSSTSTSTSS